MDTGQALVKVLLDCNEIAAEVPEQAVYVVIPQVQHPSTGERFFATEFVVVAESELLESEHDSVVLSILPDASIRLGYVVNHNENKE